MWNSAVALRCNPILLEYVFLLGEGVVKVEPNKAKKPHNVPRFRTRTSHGILCIDERLSQQHSMV